MSTTYKVIADDTFDRIARKQYGSEDRASLIARANPGVSEPLVAGTDIVVPDLPNAPQDLVQQVPADNVDEVAIRVEGKRFRFWNGVQITRTIDAMDTIEMVAPFDSTEKFLREIFQPFKYLDMDISIGGIPAFKGTMVVPLPDVKPDNKTVSVSGYSLPAVLGDCTAPAAAYPLEFSNQKLDDIAPTLANLFGLSVAFEGDPGAVFERIALEPTKNILPFLIELAKQRNLITSSTAKGELLFPDTKNPGTPVATFAQGSAPVQTIVPTFDAQKYYSHVTGIEPSVVGGKGKQFTVKNKHLTGKVRPHVFKLPDTPGADIRAAVEAKAASMFGSAIFYTMEVPTWRDAFGALWNPNTIIKVTAPDAMIYNAYEFLIRTVVLKAGKTSRTATLTLVLKGVYSGILPEALPWDE